MRLATFIEQNAEQILRGAEEFARTQMPPGAPLDSKAMRNHIPQILASVVKDLRTRQSAAQQHEKSLGHAPIPSGETAARTHGRTRAQDGFDVNQMVAEYRALRAAVIRLWAEDQDLVANSIEDMTRFHEAIDQAVAESLAEFTREVEAWRQVFLGALGHDLRGPLSVVVCYADMLSMSTENSPYAKQVSRIVSGAEHMRKLLDELLDYSRSQLGMGMVLRRSECDLAKELQEEVESLRTILPQANLNFVANGPVEGQFDCVRIREAIHNLVANAVKYGDESSDVVVSVASDSKWVQIAVKNFGQPLKDSFAKSMFDPLRRGEEKATIGESTSLGLGLFIVREIANAHGGAVTASSTYGETTFELCLPRAA